MIKTILFGRPTALPTSAEFGVTVLRLFAGLALAIAHGYGKLPPSEGFVAGVANLGFPAPVLFAWAASLAEFLGGILVAIGLCTRPAALFAAFTMAVAAFGRHAADDFATKEKALLFGTVMLAFLFIGGTRFSLDHLLAGRSGGRRRP